MLLREHHFAVLRANWEDKASNIVAIANQLSLGLDAMVFLDDSPVERNLVRETLPQIAVPELPSDPALYARTLAAAGYFETVTFSAEDAARSTFYEANASRAVMRAKIGDLDAYLVSLEMTIYFRPFDSCGRSRITQLINKSNQFNLTTRRYSEVEVERLQSDGSVFTLQGSLIDKFGDNGMIVVVIVREAGDADWEIETWLMSCRVFGRGIEKAVLAELLEHARSRGIRRLIGKYVPTDRNEMVREHYAKLGFTLEWEALDGVTRWSMDTSTLAPIAPMRVVRPSNLADSLT